MDRSKQILIVDDEEFNRELLEDMLDALGYGHISANSGHEALRMLTPITDLVLLDVMMPGMNGFEVVRQIRQHPTFYDMPIIMVTALNNKDDRLHAVEAGANDFIAKPVDKTELRVRSASLLKVKEAQDRMKSYQMDLELKVADRTSQLSQALQNLAWAQRKANEGYLDTIKRLALASEYKDARMNHHLHRVSHYCALLGRVLNMRPREIEVLSQASLMHDVGKIGVPDEILSKKGLLTPAEREIMQTHCAIGASILGGSESELLQSGAIIALSHHERWDGTGYPNRLSGDAIPLYGRICAIADVFDALTTRRSYKLAFDNKTAFEIIRSGRGTQFDPNLVDLFFEHIDDVEAIQARFREDAEANGTNDEFDLAA